jgi:hypothetical protein
MNLQHSPILDEMAAKDPKRREDLPFLFEIER